MGLWFGGPYEGGTGPASIPPPQYIGFYHTASEGDVTVLDATPHADTQVGDLLVAQMCFDKADTHGAPADWTLHASNARANDLRMTIFWKHADLDDVGSPDNNLFTISGAQAGSVVIHTIRGVGAGSPDEIAINSFSAINEGSSNGYSTAAFDTSAIDCMLLLMSGSDRTSTWDADPAYTERFEVFDGSPDQDGTHLMAATGFQRGIGTVPAVSEAIEPASNWLAVVLAIAPPLLP